MNKFWFFVQWFTVLFIAGFYFTRLAIADSLPQEEAPKCVRLCPNPTPKPKAKVRTVVKTVVKEVPAKREPQNLNNEQKQNVNIHIHNDSESKSKSGCCESKSRCRRSNFKVGVHVGCGPVGVKSVYIDPSTIRYDLRSGLVVGGSVSARVLGPAWLTGQAFSNGLLTGGVELEF